MKYIYIFLRIFVTFASWFAWSLHGNLVCTSYVAIEVWVGCPVEMLLYSYRRLIGYMLEMLLFSCRRLDMIYGDCFCFWFFLEHCWVEAEHDLNHIAKA
jgi:hypothetical protein